MNRALIVCGFPGVGKTALEKYSNVVDLESSGFRWRWTPPDPEGFETEQRLIKQRNPEWPKNYVRKIDELSKDYQKIILVSTHPEVRTGLLEADLPYIIVLPFRECKYEYMRRYLRRGSDISFLKDMEVCFNGYLTELERDPAPKIYLEPGMYLEDVLPL